jgi:hypothetical protein
MDTTPVQRRAPIVMLFLGVAAGAVAGWFAHQAVVVPRSESLTSGASPASPAAEPLIRPTESESPAAAPGALVHTKKSESHATHLASEGEIPLSTTNASSFVTRGTSRANASTGDQSEQPSAPLSQAPSLDDLHDSGSVRCTFGPGNGGSWPNGQLTVGDAAWQGGPVNFQSIDYDAGTAQMIGQVTRSPTGEVPATVTASDSDVTFTGRAANGTLTVISIFGKFDKAGHHTAVLSMHDGKHELNIAQFYGVVIQRAKKHELSSAVTSRASGTQLHLLKAVIRKWQHWVEAV